MVELYDCNLNNINLENFNQLNTENKIEIIHYLPIITKNKDFIKKYNSNPQKYLNIQENQSLETKKTYPPFHIFPNGTIDKNPDLIYQLNTYNKDYTINIISLPISEIMNESTVSKSNIFKARNLSKNGYVVAVSSNTGEFSSFANVDKFDGLENNMFFLKYPQILQNGENYKENKCFYILLSIFIINLLSVIGLIISKIRNEKYLNTKEWYENERTLILNDEKIFNFDFKTKFNFSNQVNLTRYSVYDFNSNFNDQIEKTPEKNNSKIFPVNNTLINNTSVSKCMSVIKPKMMNKTSNPIAPKALDNIEIELHVSQEIRERNNLNSDNYQMVINMFNLELQEENETRKNGSNEKILEENKNQILYEEEKENKKELNKLQKSTINNLQTEVLAITDFDTKSESFLKKLKSFVHFSFRRNIYANLFVLSSPFNPRYKFITKIFTLIYLIVGFSCIFYSNSGIDFNVN